jgi:hypothetical protein
VIDQANLRTLSPFVGGGFGSRFHSAEKLAAVRIRDPRCGRKSCSPPS